MNIIDRFRYRNELGYCTVLFQRLYLLKNNMNFLKKNS